MNFFFSSDRFSILEHQQNINLNFAIKYVYYVKTCRVTRNIKCDDKDDVI